MTTLIKTLTTLHSTLATTWLLREFHARGAPPTSSDMALVTALGDAISSLRVKGFEDVTMREVTEVLQRICGLRDAQEFFLVEQARRCLVMMEDEEWVSVEPKAED